MSIIVDAGGLSCPQPVLMTLNKIKEIQRGEILIKVDTDTSKENVSRAAKSSRLNVSINGQQITVNKDQHQRGKGTGR